MTEMNTNDVAYHDALRNSLVSMGSCYEFKKAISKNELKIGFLGGSVTMGYIPTKILPYSYPSMIEDSIKYNYGKACAIYNLGLSGTKSSMGLVYTLKEFTRFEPDIVFVEYAINQGVSQEDARELESLIRKLLNLPSNPSVIFINLITQNYYSCDEIILKIANHYKLPVISPGEGLKTLLAKELIQWNDYAIDEGHAHTNGHKFIAACIEQFINKVNSTSNYVKEQRAISMSYVFSAPYENLAELSLLDNSLYETTFNLITYHKYAFHHALINISSSKSHYFKTFLSCRGIFVVFLQNNDRNYGNAEVLVDGIHRSRLQGYSIFGWNNPSLIIIPCSDTLMDHNIEIVMEKGDEKKEFYILGLYWY